MDCSFPPESLNSMRVTKFVKCLLMRIALTFNQTLNKFKSLICINRPEIENKFK